MKYNWSHFGKLLQYKVCDLGLKKEVFDLFLFLIVDNGNYMLF